MKGLIFALETSLKLNSYRDIDSCMYWSSNIVTGEQIAH